ncbi:UNVERIFIED_CONTAM: hypothetical protein FKN15_010466 [Acipenser sinensis]
MKGRGFFPLQTWPVPHCCKWVCMPPWMDGATPAIRQVQALDAERYVSVRLEDGTWSLYPYVWLWDNCQWAHCFLHSAKACKLLLADLDVTTAMERVTLTEPTKELKSKIPVTSSNFLELEADGIIWGYRVCYLGFANQQFQDCVVLLQNARTTQAPFTR